MEMFNSCLCDIASVVPAHSKIQRGRTSAAALSSPSRACSNSSRDSALDYAGDLLTHGYRGEMIAIEVGPWYEWAGVVVAALAFSATIVLLLQQQRQLKFQSKQIAIQREDATVRAVAETRAQAEKFWAWFAPVNTSTGSGTPICFHNGSDLFIYEAVAVLRDWRTGANAPDPTDPIEPAMGIESVAIAVAVPPGETIRMMAADAFGAMGFRAGIEVGFTDAAGRHWRRSIGGPLQELSDSAIITYGFCYPISDTESAGRRRRTLRC